LIVLTQVSTFSPFNILNVTVFNNFKKWQDFKQKKKGARNGEPDILLKFSKDKEARALSSSSPSSKIPFN